MFLQFSCTYIWSHATYLSITQYAKFPWQLNAMKSSQAISCTDTE